MRPELSRALQVLDVPVPTQDDDADELALFANGAADSTWGMQVDWKVTNVGVLEDLMARFEREVPLDLVPEGDDCDIVVEDDAGAEHVTRISGIEALPRDAVVAAFLRVLPGAPVAFKLKYFEDGDSDEYLILEQDRAEALAEALGPLATTVVQRID